MYYNSNFMTSYRAEDGKVLGRIKEGIKSSFPTSGGQDFRFFVEPLSPVPAGYEGALSIGFTGFMSRIGYDTNAFSSEKEAEEALRRDWTGSFVSFTPALRNNRYYVLEELHKETVPAAMEEGAFYFPVPIFNLRESLILAGDINRFVQFLAEGKPLPGLSKRYWNQKQYTPMVAARYRDAADGEEKMLLCMPTEKDGFDATELSEGGAYFATTGDLSYTYLKKGGEMANRILFCDEAPLFFATKDVLAALREEARPLSEGGFQSVPEVVSVTAEAASVAAEETAVKAMPVPKKDLAEDEFLRRFFALAKEKALLYDEKDLLNFHIAAKTARLTILAGMSGTGKSALIRLYAEALGLAAEQLAMPAVRPSWMDDSDVLGYLDMKNMTYRPADTGLTELLIAAEKHPEKLYIVCFDEMNLARAEHYFAQFISAMENDKETVIRLYNPALASRIYNSPVYPPEIHVGSNVIFTGTINVDESTYHFSDKILDRANVITLRPGRFRDLAGLVPKEAAPQEEISAKTYAGFRKEGASIALSAEELGFFDDLNALLLENGGVSAIGFRVVRQIGSYLENIPDGSGISRAEAFDKQLVQRVLTKLRGSAEQLKTLVSLDEKGNLTGALEALLARHSELAAFEAARAMLVRKAKELKLYDYTI